MKYLPVIGALMLLAGLAGSLFGHPLSPATAWPLIGLLGILAAAISGKPAEASE